MIDQIRQIVSEDKFRSEVIAFLVDICSVDTTATADIRLMAENEKKVFDIIKKNLGKFSFENTTIHEKKISPAIKDHPAFSKLQGLDAEEVYRDRHNLLYYIDGPPSRKGNNTAVNAHIDVVAPFFAPERKGDVLLGRGVIDDKGGVASIYGALKVLDRLSREKRIFLKNNITAMFVVEEESGGNGSLDLAVDKELKKRYDSVLVMECAGNKVYPANRGAVWFKCGITVRDKTATSGQRVTPSLLEAMIFSVLEMQQEGDAVKKESTHPLFPHKPVQTCNGMLGPFGEHPSRICGVVKFLVRGISDTGQCIDMLTLLQNGLNSYIAKYGDKTRVFDINTGKPKVEKHFDTEYDPENNAMTIRVYGSPGHMASLQEHDAAITKLAYLGRELINYRIGKGIPLELELEGVDSTRQLILEGGQGFLPTHSIGEIEERMSNAFKRGVKKYLQLAGQDEDIFQCEVTYEKLHNNAYYTSPESTTFKNALKSSIEAGITDRNAPVLGWDASCDARLFAGEYPNMPVITSGAGELRYAHADNEQLYLPDLFDSICFTTLFLLKETGSVIS